MYIVINRNKSSICILLSHISHFVAQTCLVWPTVWVQSQKKTPNDSCTMKQ